MSCHVSCRKCSLFYNQQHVSTQHSSMCNRTPTVPTVRSYMMYACTVRRLPSQCARCLHVKPAARQLRATRGCEPQCVMLLPFAAYIMARSLASSSMNVGLADGSSLQHCCMRCERAGGQAGGMGRRSPCTPTMKMICMETHTCTHMHTHMWRFHAWQDAGGAHTQTLC